MPKMIGVFRKGYFSNIIGLLSGLFLVIFFGFFLVSGKVTSLDDRIAIWFFACFGLFICILCSISLYVNHRAYIHVDAETISAFCHFGLALECRFSDVRFVSYGGNGLNIHLVSGRKYCLMGLENAYAIGRFIESKCQVNLTNPAGRDALLGEISRLKRKRKTTGIAAVICFLLTLPCILISAALTGWRDLHDFSPGDWTVFAIIGGACVAIFAVCCMLLRKSLQHTDELNGMQRTLQQASYWHMPPREEIIEHMQSLEYSGFSGTAVREILSKDRARRFIIVQNENRYFQTVYEEIQVYDQEERVSFGYDPDRYPAWWAPAGITASFYGSEEDALRSIAATPEYKLYFE